MNAQEFLVKQVQGLFALAKLQKKSIELLMERSTALAHETDHLKERIEELEAERWEVNRRLANLESETGTEER